MAHGENLSSKLLKCTGENSLVTQMVSVWIDIPHRKKSFSVYTNDHLHSLARMVAERCDSQRSKRL